jgi:hypothetical protein
MHRLDNQLRAFRLIDEAIERLDVDLSELRVLTEAASGAYIVTALTAARARADCVYAVTRNSPHGAADDVIAYGRDWAEAFGVADRIKFVAGAAAACAADADIVTNLGFVRPIDRALVSCLPRHAVVSLMWEPWEFRPQDIDAQACADAGIPVIGTNEADHRLRIFEYVGMLVVKLLLESGIEGPRSRVLVLGSDPLGEAVRAMLASLGADATRVVLPQPAASLDTAFGAMVERADAVVLVEHRERRELIGLQGGIRPERFLAGGCRLVHVAGNVDDGALERLKVTKHPARRVMPGFMTVATDYVGPRPVIDLHAAGLKVGADAVRCRLAGGSQSDAVTAAEASGLGLRVTRGLADMPS